MNNIEKAREQINIIDKEMAQLFEKRMNAAGVIAEYKAEHGLSIKDEKREEAVIENNRGYINDPVIEALYVNYQKNLMDISCKYQAYLTKGVSVAYCGVPGAFSFIAARKMFPDSLPITYKTFDEAYSSVENGENDCVVVPIENSTAGDVDMVVDLIFNGSLFINQIIEVDIEHHLLGLPGTSAKDIKTVVSHPQALEQCQKYIQQMGLEEKAYSNTALAAQFVRESGDKSIAAIASKETAHIFDLEVIGSNINSEKNNATRFAALSRTKHFPIISGNKSNERFIIMFTVPDEAGALAQTLNIIGIHGYNMLNLRSRPMKNLKWNYYFYIEAEGCINNRNGEDMLRELSAICERLRLVGVYSVDKQ